MKVNTEEHNQNIRIKCCSNSIVSALYKRQIGHYFNCKKMFQTKYYNSFYKIAKLKKMHTLKHPNKYKLSNCYQFIMCLDFNRDGNFLSTSVDYNNISIWDWKREQCITSFKSSCVYVHRFLQFPGNSHIAYCCLPGTIKYTQITESEYKTWTLGDHEANCRNLIVHLRRPNVIISVGENGTVFRYDIRKNGIDLVLKTPYRLWNINGHPENEYEFCISKLDGQVVRYDERKSKYPLAIHGDNHCELFNAIYNYNGNEILAAYEDGAYLFDVNKPGQQVIQKYKCNRHEYNFYGKKSEIIMGYRDDIYFWDKTTAKQFQAAENEQVYSVTTHPKLPFICSGGMNGVVKIWIPMDIR